MKILKEKGVVPGFGPTFGFTVFYLSLLVVIPLSMLFFKTATLSPAALWEAISSPRLLASLRLSFGASFLAALINAFFGLLVAWVLVRYRFAGKWAIDMLIDLPFALPTAVAGIALTSAFSGSGIVGRFLESIGIRVVFTPLGIVAALTFIGLPFVIRTVQPVLQDMNQEIEEAAICLGASRRQTFLHVILPVIFPAVLSGFVMAFARGLGEYGSVVFIAGNLPMKSEIVPLLIMTKLEQYDYAGATALAAVMLLASFGTLFLIHWLQAWSRSQKPIEEEL
ncbi:MAG: sulfate ABC transporter permease subunit CysT [Deltaproteobacteria bacterium]|nr:sulfate ABC transporter permease subunit CysT [Deltaproteobacteria bacterium]MBI4373358.1 sulfate ABC transporter permease subunit CysT [Deltaproteobacteria bacterium]